MAAYEQGMQLPLRSIEHDPDVQSLVYPNTMEAHPMAAALQPWTLSNGVHAC